jgi:hypothetical protein
MAGIAASRPAHIAAAVAMACAQTTLSGVTMNDPMFRD